MEVDKQQIGLHLNPPGFANLQRGFAEDAYASLKQVKMPTPDQWAPNSGLLKSRYPVISKGVSSLTMVCPLNQQKSDQVYQVTVSTFGMGPI